MSYSRIQNLFHLFSGLHVASKLLKQKTIKKLIDWLVKEPFSPSTSNTCYVPREEKFVNLTILDSKEYEKKFSNSDREVLMKQRLQKRDGLKMSELFQKNDDIVIARGVAGKLLLNPLSSTLYRAITLIYTNFGQRRWPKPFCDAHFDFEIIIFDPT